MARATVEGSVLGPATQVTGRVSGDSALRIEGTLKGDVTVGGPCEIAEGATVDGNVQAEALDVGGSLVGDVTTKGPIYVRSGATVRGELRGARVAIEPGSRIAVRLECEFELDFGTPRRK